MEEGKEKEHDPSVDTEWVDSPNIYDSLPSYEEVLEWDSADGNDHIRHGGPLSDPSTGAIGITKKKCEVCRQEIEQLYTRKKGHWKCNKMHVNMCFECVNKGNCPMCPGKWPMTPEGKLKGPKKQ